jgi:hypothetical protein
MRPRVARSRAAIHRGGFAFPSLRITVNLAPAEAPKEGTFVRPCDLHSRSSSIEFVSTLGVLIGAIAALLTVTVATLQFARSSFGQRYQIRRNLDILRDLPDGATRARLAANVEDAVRLLLDREAVQRPLPPQLVALSAAYLLGATAAFIAAAVSNVWQIYILGASLVLSVAVGFILRWQLNRQRSATRHAAPVDVSRPDGGV